MSRLAGTLVVALLVAEGTVPPVLAGGGGGPPVWMMTQNYCREVVYKRGITEVTAFEQEVRKCMADPVTYPTDHK